MRLPLLFLLFVPIVALCTWLKSGNSTLPFFSRERGEEQQQAQQKAILPGEEEPTAHRRTRFIRVVGEPKSGTTWLERILVASGKVKCSGEQACSFEGGVPEDRSLRLQRGDGALQVLTSEGKHRIHALKRCLGGRGVLRPHRDDVDTAWPCSNVMASNSTSPSAAKLMNCLPTRCAEEEPFDTIFILVLRDPRDVIISEFFMLHGNEEENTLEDRTTFPGLVDFVQERFVVRATWVWVRYMWHITVLRRSSYVILYHELRLHDEPYRTICWALNFQCDAEDIHEIREESSPERMREMQGKGTLPGGLGKGERAKVRSAGKQNFNDYGLPLETVGWMNVTLKAMMPRRLLGQWDLL